LKILKRIGIIALMLILAGIVFRGWLYRHLVTYKTIGERTNYTANDSNLIEFIVLNSKYQGSEVKSIIETSLSLTSKTLAFSDGHHDQDPNMLITTKRANCIGYAAFFSTVCNQILAEHNLDAIWIARPLIGQLYFWDTNVHPYFKSAFFKDHDFAVIENKSTGEIYAVDPSLNDYTGIKYVRFNSAIQKQKRD